MNVWRTAEHTLFVYWLIMMMKVTFSLNSRWQELEWEDDSFNSCKLSNFCEYTQDRFIWFMINSYEYGWSTTFCGEQAARIEVIPNGRQNIIVFVLENMSAHLSLYRVGYITRNKHWSTAEFSRDIHFHVLFNDSLMSVLWVGILFHSYGTWKIHTVIQQSMWIYRNKAKKM